MTETTPPKKSDLAVRTASAVVMLTVAGTALWLGGWFWAGFVGLVAAGVLFEWRRLAARIAQTPMAFGLWNIAGIFYIGFAAAMLLFLRSESFRISMVLMLVAAVVATDIGAYFAGRTFGGPKIAPAISPSKTWAGLLGGVLGASLAVFFLADSCLVEYPTSQFEHWRICFQTELFSFRTDPFRVIVPAILNGGMVAIAAQSGDFFESWMKRRAGVKDSGNLIPGHGGIFDRVDGLLAVCFVTSLLVLPVRFLLP